MKKMQIPIYFLLIISALLCFVFFGILHQEEAITISSAKERMNAYLLSDDVLVEVTMNTSNQKSEDKMIEIVHSMMQEGGGFQSLLNTDTVLEKVMIKDQVMILDFSSLSYEADKELRLLEALLYNATQFSDVKKLEITMNGELLKSMPKKQTPIVYHDRRFGINHLKNTNLYLHEGSQLEFYYEKEVNGKTYPVLQSVRIKNRNDYNEIMRQMLSSLNAASQLNNPLYDRKVRMSQPCKKKDKVLILYLNSEVLTKDKTVKKEIVSLLKKNLSQLKELDAFSISVNDVVISINGKNKINLS